MSPYKALNSKAYYILLPVTQSAIKVPAADVIINNYKATIIESE